MKKTFKEFADLKFSNKTWVHYPFSWFLNLKWISWIWMKVFCRRGRHLLSYCLSSGGYPYAYLHCDSCGLMIYVNGIDNRYVKDKKVWEGSAVATNSTMVELETEGIETTGIPENSFWPQNHQFKE